MKRTISKRIVIYMFTMLGMGILAEGCKSSKNCGCGSDIGAMYKPYKQRHRR